jgi:hypothetical protein
LGCGAKTHKVGGETNWLTACETESDCSAGSCLCGLCTRECDDDEACVDIPDSVCSATDSALHVASCGSSDEPTVCVEQASPVPADAGNGSTDAGSGSTEDTWEGAVSKVVFEGEVFSNIWAADGALWAAGFRLPSTTSDPDAPQPGPALQCPQNWTVETVVRRRSGDTWDLVEQPAKTGLNGMHGSSADDVWLVGFDGTVVQLTGSAWREHDVRTTDNLQFAEETELCSELSLYSVFARTPNDVWVVGRIFPSGLGPGLVFALRRGAVGASCRCGARGLD